MAEGSIKMAYIKEYWNDKDKRAEQARKHTKDMAEKYSRCIETSILATKIYDVDYFENIEFEEDIDKANLFMSKEVNVTDTEYFILFKDRRPEIIQKRIQNIVSGLANAGLQSAQVSNDDLRVLLDGFMNGGDTTKFGTVMSSI